MTMKWASISVVGAALAVALALPASASAEKPVRSPGSDGQVVVAPATVRPGDTITVTGNCPQGKKLARIWYSSSMSHNPTGVQENVPAGAHGIVSATTDVDSGATPGSYQAAVWCDSGNAPYSTAFTVSGTGDADARGALGANGNTLVLAGVGVLAAVAVASAIHMQRRGVGTKASER